MFNLNKTKLVCNLEINVAFIFYSIVLVFVCKHIWTQTKSLPHSLSLTCFVVYIFVYNWFCFTVFLLLDTLMATMRRNGTLEQTTTTSAEKLKLWASLNIMSAHQHRNRNRNRNAMNRIRIESSAIEDFCFNRNIILCILSESSRLSVFYSHPSQPQWPASCAPQPIRHSSPKQQLSSGSSSSSKHHRVSLPNEKCQMQLTICEQGGQGGIARSSSSGGSSFSSTANVCVPVPLCMRFMPLGGGPPYCHEKFHQDQPKISQSTNHHHHNHHLLLYSTYSALSSCWRRHPPIHTDMYILIQIQIQRAYTRYSYISCERNNNCFLKQIYSVIKCGE